MRHSLIVLILMAMALQACGVDRQQGAINDARFAVSLLDTGVEFGSAIVETELEGCDQAKGRLVIGQARAANEINKNSLDLWQLALNKYVAAKKEHGAKSEEAHAARMELLNSEAEWFPFAQAISGIFRGVADIVQLSRHIPKWLSFAFMALGSLAPGTDHDPPEWDWSNLPSECRT